LRLHGQDGGQGNQLLFAPGKLIGDPFLKALKSEPGDGVASNPDGFRRSLSLVQRTEGHILDNGRTEELVVGILKQQAHLLPDLDEVLLFGNFLPEDHNFSRLGAQQTHDQVQESGLAAAVGTNEADVLARQELIVEILKNREGCSRIAEGNVFEFDQGFTHPSLTVTPGNPHSR